MRHPALGVRDAEASAAGAGGPAALELSAVSINGASRYALRLGGAAVQVRDLKAQIEAAGGPPAAQQRLLLGEHLLADAATADDLAALRGPQAPAACGGPAELTLVTLATFGEEHRVRGLLDEIRADNVEATARQLSLVEFQSAEELEAFARLLFAKAIAEPSCSETCAELMDMLGTRCQEFPPADEGTKPVTFSRLLLNVCQGEFERLFESLDHPPQAHDEGQAETETPTPLADDGQQRVQPRTLSDELCACMRLVGNLFVRRKIAIKVIGQIMHDLIGVKDKPPTRIMVDGACELLQHVGVVLALTPHGKVLLAQFCSRLTRLKQAKDGTGGALYPERTQGRIQSQLDLWATA